MDKYDVVVIGAGPAGFSAAVRCAQLGMKTACIDNWRNKEGKHVLGGACLNAGCVPSKALLESSECYHDLQERLAGHGILVEGVRLDLNAMIDRKNKIVHALRQNSAAVFKKHDIRWIPGKGRLALNQQVAVTAPDGETETVLQATDIIIATGSMARAIKGITVDHELVVSPTEALDFDAVPGRLGVIGAGAVGVELGAVWQRLGAEVILLDALPEFLPYIDQEVAGTALNEFRRQGLDIRLGVRVLHAKPVGGRAVVRCQDAQGEQDLEFDKVIVAMGRKPQTEGLDAEDIGLVMNELGLVHVDEYCRTNLPGIYAVGDVVHGPMLAHKGAEEGVLVAEHIAGQEALLNHETIPWVIYTTPEIAWVGKTERELKAEAVPFRSGAFPLSASGRARTMSRPVGMVKILAHAETDRILGVHIFAPSASEMIAEAVVAMEFAASAEDLARIVHAHPSISEALHEAALDVADRSLQL